MQETYKHEFKQEKMIRFLKLIAKLESTIKIVNLGPIEKYNKLKRREERHRVKDSENYENVMGAFEQHYNILNTKDILTVYKRLDDNDPQVNKGISAYFGKKLELAKKKAESSRFDLQDYLKNEETITENLKLQEYDVLNTLYDYNIKDTDLFTVVGFGGKPSDPHYNRLQRVLNKQGKNFEVQGDFEDSDEEDNESNTSSLIIVDKNKLRMIGSSLNQVLDKFFPSRMRISLELSPDSEQQELEIKKVRPSNYVTQNIEYFNILTK